MKRFFIILGLISVFSISQIFAQENESQAKSDSEAGNDSSEAFAIIPELQAEETSNLLPGRTRAIFKTNVKSCSIFVNGNFQGRSNLTLTNLVEGYYLLRVEKDGYDYQENFVYVENGKAKTFYVELQPNEETQKRMDARAERAATREAEKAAKTEETQNNDENSVQSSDAGIGDVK